MVTTMQRAPMTEHGTTSSLIASDRVEGTAVYDAHGKRIGKVERLMIDKLTGRVLGSAFGIVMAAFIGAVQARDDGRYSLSPLKPWFDGLRSGKGACCSDADGFALSDPDWESKSGHYRVRVDNEWIDAPDDAVITEPNRAGRTMVWPIKGSLGTSIRCFMPGSMT